MSWSFVVDCEPAPKERPRHGKNGHTFTPAKTERYEAAVRACAQAAGIREPFRCAVGLHIICYVPTLGAGDWDNLGKAVSDALNKTAYVDDRQVVDAHVQKVLDRERPRAEVWLWTVPDSPFVASDRKPAAKKKPAKQPMTVEQAMRPSAPVWPAIQRKR